MCGILTSCIRVVPIIPLCCIVCAFMVYVFLPDNVFFHYPVGVYIIIIDRIDVQGVIKFFRFKGALGMTIGTFF